MDPTITFEFKGEEHRATISLTSGVVKLTIKKAFEPFMWAASLSEKDMASSSWKMLGDISNVPDFIKYCLENKTFSINQNDEMKIVLNFVLDTKFKKFDLPLVALPGEMDTTKLIYELVSMVKDLSKSRKVKKKWGPSRIISDEDFSMVSKWINSENPGKVQLELLYQATNDGFEAANFHSKCNGKGPAITFIKNTLGFVFGGYTAIGWHSNSSYSIDNAAFTFSITRKEKCLKKPTASDAIYGNANYGPTFGSGHDIYVCDNSSTSASSYCNGNNVYNLSGNYAKMNRTFYAGSYYFLTKEIEVYLVK